MKILMVNKFLFPNGGSETYMFELGKMLESRGHEVQYFGMDDESRCVSNEIDCYVDKIDYASVSAIKKLMSPIKTVYSKEAKTKIGKVIEAFKPDVVHMNNINFQLTPSIIYETKKHGIPIVQTVHDVQIACPNHRMYIEQNNEVCTRCKSGSYTNCIKNKCIHGSTLQSAVAAVESIYYHKKNTYNLVDRYICPSNFIAEQIKDGGVEDGRISVIHNYSKKIDFVGKKSDEKYLLYFGRLSVEKGLGMLFDVMEELPEVRLVVAGSGPIEDELSGRELANVEFVGFKSGEELYALIAGAFASVYPSTWFENCPMSVIESINLGTPVITCDIGGTKELIDNGKNGLIYKSGDKNALKEAVKTLYENDSLTSNMSAYCLQNGSTLPLESYTEKIEEIYQALI